MKESPSAASQIVLEVAQLELCTGPGSENWYSVADTSPVAVYLSLLLPNHPSISDQHTEFENEEDQF